jgi:hypothetical protein
MECRAFDQRERSWPSGPTLLGQNVARPPVCDRVLVSELAKRERPSDPAAKLGRDRVELVAHPMFESRVSRDLGEVTVGVFPLESCAFEVRRHEL